MSKLPHLARLATVATILMVSLAAVAGGSAVAVESHQVDGNAVVALVHNAGSEPVMVSEVTATATLVSGDMETSMSAPFVVASGESKTVRLEFSDAVASVSGGVTLGHSEDPSPW